MRKVLELLLVLLLILVVIFYLITKEKNSVLGTQSIENSAQSSSAYRASTFLKDDVDLFLFDTASELHMISAQITETLFKWESEGAIQEVVGKKLTVNIPAEKLGELVLAKGFVHDEMNSLGGNVAFEKDNLVCLIVDNKTTQQVSIICGIAL